MGDSARFPFGEDVDTLVICHDPAHAVEVQKAFGLKAEYHGTNTPGLTGSRYSKIIVFRPLFHTMSACEALAYVDWFNEYLPLKLRPGGAIVSI